MYFFCLVFDFLICSVDVTKKKEKRKKKSIVKRKCVICILFMNVFFV
jgi:uncharacterized membrane protein